MKSSAATVHTTLNLSKKMINEALRLFKDKSKTEIIHEALQEKIRRKKIEKHLTRWKGKGKFKSYD